jgi:hypothetical protein
MYAVNNDSPQVAEKIHQLYPAVPSAPTGDLPPYTPTDPNTMRYDMVHKWIIEIEDELKKREILSKKYRRAVDITDIVNTSLLSGAVGSAIVGFTLSVSLIGLPLGLIFHSSSAVLGAGGLVGRFCGRHFEKKARKHAKVAVLAQSTVETLEVALANATIVTKEELDRLKDEVDRYRSRKTHIIAPTSLDNKKQKSLIQQGRVETQKMIASALDQIETDV